VCNRSAKSSNPGQEIAQIVELHALAIQGVIHSLVGGGQKVAVDIQQRL
jgi:hypothetical protein